MASRRRFELPVSKMKSWRPGPLDERDKGFLYIITLEHLIKICQFLIKKWHRVGESNPSCQDENLES